IHLVHKNCVEVLHRVPTFATVPFCHCQSQSVNYYPTSTPNHQSTVYPSSL
ncbi:unnamed protein product, partial [Tenebrio molitor]